MKKIFIPIFLFLGFLLVFSALLGLYIGFMKSARVVFGFMYILFFPGFLTSLLLLPPPQKDEWWERAVLAVPFSLALVPLVIVYAYLAGVSLDAYTIFFITTAVIAVELILLVFFNRNKKHG